MNWRFSCIGGSGKTTDSRTGLRKGAQSHAPIRVSSVPGGRGEPPPWARARADMLLSAVDRPGSSRAGRLHVRLDPFNQAVLESRDIVVQLVDLTSEPRA